MNSRDIMATAQPGPRSRTLLGLALLAPALLGQMLWSQTAVAADFSGNLKSQTSFNLQGQGLQQQEWLLDLEYNDSLGNGELTAIGRLRFDSVDDLNPAGSSRPDNYSPIGGPQLSGRNGAAGLRELYWQYSGESSFWQIGKQQVVWGEADGLKLLDLVNPQDFREFVLDDLCFFFGGALATTGAEVTTGAALGLGLGSGFFSSSQPPR